jgi:hypothetical protein
MLKNLIKFPNVKLHKILPVSGLTVPYGQAQGREDRHDHAHSLCTQLPFERARKAKKLTI